MLLCAALLAVSGVAFPRNSDRSQPMDINSDRAEGTLDGNGITVLTGSVSIQQGTLDIRAARADVHQRGGEAVRAVLTGKQATLKQQMDDGSVMSAKADRIDYDMNTDVIVLTGNFSVTTPRGSSSGQRLTYDMKTGRVESGGQGNGRVSLRFVPKTAQGGGAQNKAPDKPATQDAP